MLNNETECCFCAFALLGSCPVIAPLLQGVVRVIFKVRDDLRQDQLVLNILKQMDQIWKEDPKVGDLHMTAYAVVPTWEEGGVVQVCDGCRYSMVACRVPLCFV